MTKREFSELIDWSLRAALIIEAIMLTVGSFWLTIALRALG